MDGEISGLIQSAILLSICTVALAGTLAYVSGAYGLTQPTQVQGLVDVANSSTSGFATFANQSTANITDNRLAQNLLWITSGGFNMLNLIMGLPSIFNSLLTAFIYALTVPLGVAPELTGVVVTGIYTIILCTIIFAVASVVFKVKL
jgi:hypothetical protein